MSDKSESPKEMPPFLKIIPTIYPTSQPLDENLAQFWSVGPRFESVKVKIEPPEEPLAILEELGPSPFSGGGFPLIGFLATTYDKVSRYALERVDRADATNYE